MTKRPTLIVALDFSDQEQALTLCESLDGLVDYYKVGSELFTAAGPGFGTNLVGERDDHRQAAVCRVKSWRHVGTYMYIYLYNI